MGTISRKRRVCPKGCVVINASDRPRVLLFSSTPPGDNSVGEIFLRDLCDVYPHDRISCFCIASPGLTVARGWKQSQALAWLPTEYNEWWGHRRGGNWWREMARKAAANAAFKRARTKDANVLLDRAEAFARSHGAEMIWAVLGSPLMYLLAAPLADRLGVPLVTTVWDPFERIARDFDLSGDSRRAALDAFASALRRSLRVGVMCESMRDEYARLYDAKGVIMRHGVDESLLRDAAPALGSDDTLTIGYGGSLYALDEWKALIDALQSVSWNLDGRKVKVVVYGSNARVNTPEGAHVEFMGWRPMHEVVEGLAAVDVNYLPYWFDEDHRPDVRLCFPTKLTSYLATGRPIFYHGPRDSSPVAFFKDYPAAVSCHSLDSESILESLRKVVRDRGEYARMTRAGADAVAKELNRRVFIERFNELIG